MMTFTFLLAVAALVIGFLAFLKLAHFPTPPVGAMTTVLVIMLLAALLAGSLAERAL